MTIIYGRDLTGQRIPIIEDLLRLNISNRKDLKLFQRVRENGIRAVIRIIIRIPGIIKTSEIIRTHRAIRIAGIIIRK